jgi:hypothetical protein
MNERIKQLAEQAGFDIEVEDIFKYKPQHSFIGSDENIEKFAELIVRECIDVVSQCNLVDVDPIAHIKVHFGVE